MWCVIFVAVAGLSDELVQGLIPGRCVDIKDWMTDMGTCILTILLIALVICPKLEKWRIKLESLKSKHYEKQRWAYEYKHKRGKSQVKHKPRAK